MCRTVFEISRTAAAGRLGRLEVPRADCAIETPAMLPVVNPHVQTISPATLAEEFGAEILITNAYVLYRSEDLHDAALTQGVHDLLDFPGAIMTDSGSFQLAEYGAIDVDTASILAFQDAIGSDIATPVDLPTPPDVSRDQAETELEDTQAAIATATTYDSGDMLVTGPIQGSTFPDLRRQAATDAYATGLDIYPIGAVVPLLRDYRFDDVVRVVDAAKRGLGADAPVHLFGAGHPMMFSLGVALGCDLFDSAAYALYAREGRYLRTTGTTALEHLTAFPCTCPVCADRTPEAVRALPPDEQEQLLTRHNLYVTFAELRRVRQAIQDGTLMELLETRVRAHPGLLDGYRALLEQSDRIREHTPVSGRRPMFYLSGESARRPIVRRHHRRLARLAVPDQLVLVDPHVLADQSIAGYFADDGIAIDLRQSAIWFVVPPFGPVPPALGETYPLTAELPTMRDVDAYWAASAGIEAVTDRATSITLVHADWPPVILDALPPTVHTAREHPVMHQ